MAPAAGVNICVRKCWQIFEPSMLFNQELCLAESLSLLRLPWNHISPWNPPGVYGGWDQIFSLCELKTRQELMEVTNKGRRKR